jgi:tRNA-uridine 2-sulfurtransferase
MTIVMSAVDFFSAFCYTHRMKRRSSQKKKVLIALSGGIDSAVSAYLLIRQGYEVEAAFMKNWSSTEGLLKNDCPWLTDRQDALRVAAFLRMPMHTLDFEKQYERRVMKYFFDEYRKGRTPNPDVMCNKEIKFKLLYDWAIRRGFDYLATGHYALINTTPSAGAATPPLAHKERKKEGSTAAGPTPLLSKDYTSSKEEYPAKRGEVVYYLSRSPDEFKDQTYFIYNIRTHQLPHLLFPIGGMKKTAVRALARKLGLPNAEKKESMGLCFVGKIRLGEFLKQKLKERFGEIIGNNGKVIGRHHGLHNYTIGQRQGIQVGAGGPYYVVKKDLKHNRLYVTDNPDDPALLTKELQIHSVNWIGKKFVLEPVEGQISAKAILTHSTGSGIKIALTGRYRHQGILAPLTIEKNGLGNYKVHFFQPQKAVASGQSLVLYEGKVCLGGGVIV